MPEGEKKIDTKDVVALGLGAAAILAGLAMVRKPTPEREVKDIEASFG